MRDKDKYVPGDIVVLKQGRDYTHSVLLWDHVGRAQFVDKPTGTVTQKSLLMVISTAHDAMTGWEAYVITSDGTVGWIVYHVLKHLHIETIDRY